MSWRALSERQVTELVTALTGLRWPRHRSEMDELLAELGWSTAVEPRERHAFLNTGLEPFNGRAVLRFSGDGIGDLSVALTDAVKQESPEARDFHRDALATAARAVTGVLGDPAVRRGGAEPLLRWEVPGGELRLLGGGAFLELSLLSAAEVRALAAEESDEDGS